MSFIKTHPRHWCVADFDFACSGPALAPSQLHIAKTICLLESRCDDYADHLRAVFRDREQAWLDAVDRWNFEECQHGEVLRALCEAADPGFEFDSTMHAYQELVHYHEPTGQSVRGSIAGELVARCVVEALASALYRVLADAAEDATVRAMYSTLAQDEARHFAMFLRMLNALAAGERASWRRRIAYAIRRMLQLEDGQIMAASGIVAGRQPTTPTLRREANWYLGRLYGLYRWKHARYATQMLLRTVQLDRWRILLPVGTALLLAAVKLRWLLAAASSRLWPPR